MFCTRCGKKSFPVRIACKACNATLQDVPALLDIPEERVKQKQVKCAQCGSTAVDGRIACSHCDASLPRPFALSDEDGPPEHAPGIAYYTIASPKHACEECRKWHGFCFLPHKLRDFRTPIPTCKYPVCWCGVWGVFWTQGTAATTERDGTQSVHHSVGDASDVAAFLERAGGSATDQQVQAYIDAQLAPARARSARERAGVELWTRAYRSEKYSTDQSISLYRESIRDWKGTLTADPACRWDYLQDAYNRLTLLLERSRRFAEALSEIQDYRAFWAQAGRKPEAGTILRREERLKKRLLKPG